MASPVRPPGKPGAPTKLTEELIENISNFIRMGSYLETAAESCGISRTVFLNWLRKGNKQKSGLHAALVRAVHKAAADAQQRDLKAIDDAAQGKGGFKRDWKAAAWKMERRNRSTWGAFQKLEVAGNQEEPLSVTVKIIPPKKADGDPT